MYEIVHILNESEQLKEYYFHIFLSMNSLKLV
jgi:hypothetical protein